ncbi:VOC family protein [Geodermatophilus sp. SYSU D00815]
MTRPVTYPEISPDLATSRRFFTAAFGWEPQPFAAPDHLVAPGGEHGGSVVVEPFVIAGVGRGCYVVDPAGVLLALHEYDPDAR